MPGPPATAKAISDGSDWDLWQAEGRGGAIVLANYASVRSYSLARLKADSSSRYRCKDDRTPRH